MFLSSVDHKIGFEQDERDSQGDDERRFPFSCGHEYQADHLHNPTGMTWHELVWHVACIRSTKI